MKVLENDNLYVRVDLPGVPDDAVRLRVDAVRQKVVFFSGETVMDKEGVREYSGTAGLGCDCCEITGVDAKMKDGVLRMILSRVKVNKDQQNNKCTNTMPLFTGSIPFLSKVTIFAAIIVVNTLYFCWTRDRSIRNTFGGSSVCCERSQGSIVWGSNSGRRALLCSGLARCLCG